MDEEEKAIYSQIFSFTAKMRRKRKYAKFAADMLMMLSEYEPGNETLTFCWDFLKMYASITTNESDDNKWDECVYKMDEFSRQGMPQRKMGAVLLAELERRAREHDLR